MSEKVALVQDGQVRFAIHRLPWQRAEEVLEIADELARVLSISIDSTVPYAVFHLPSDQPVALILELDLESDLGDEGFEVTSSPEKLTLRARTVAGLSHAGYWFLEKVVGACWLWPGSDGEVIPKHRNLTFEVGQWREEPDYAWRRIGTSGPIHQAMDYDTTLHALHGMSLQYIEDFKTWCKRNRFGGLNVVDGHRFVQIAPPEKYAESKSHVYALVDGQRDTAIGDGKHGNQPCLTHPDTTAIMANYTGKLFDADPTVDAFSIALNDGGQHCQCPTCVAFDEDVAQTGKLGSADVDRAMDEAGDASHAIGAAVTDRVVWQANQVAKKVCKKHPSRKLMILLYAHYRKPPIKHILDSRVMGQYCIRGSQFWVPEFRDKELKQICEMSKVVPTLGIYEYYSQGVWSEAHRIFPKLIEQSLRAFHETGVRYFATQPTTGFSTNGINLFVLGRCLWDVETTSEAVIADWCQAGFGSAADAINRYVYAFADRWQQTRSGTTVGEAPSGYGNVWLLAHLYPKHFIEQRYAELEKAREKAKDDQAVVKRIDFLAKGLEFTAKVCAASEATVKVITQMELDATQSPVRSKSETNVAQLAQDARTAVAAWDDFWSYTKSHKGQYVFGEFWIYYRVFRGNENAPFIQLLRKIAAGECP